MKNDIVNNLNDDIEIINYTFKKITDSINRIDIINYLITSKKWRLVISIKEQNYNNAILLNKDNGIFLEIFNKNIFYENNYNNGIILIINNGKNYINYNTNSINKKNY